MTTHTGQPSTEQREEMFRSYATAYMKQHAEHVIRQTSALETIRALLGVLVLLLVLGGIMGAIAVTQG